MAVRPHASSQARLRIVPSAPEGADGPARLSDDELIEAVQARDHRAASEIYDRLFGVVDHTLYRVLGQRGPDHDDLVQQAFEQVVLTLSRHAFARMCSLRTWASRVATNVGLNALRSRRRERAVIDRGAPADPESGTLVERDLHGTVDSRMQLARVRSVLSAMKAEQVEVLLLHDVMGHDLTEIALMVGVSVPAAQSRLFRGRKDLRVRLERLGLGPGPGGGR